MRMWMLPPEQLCRKHLLGEHVELHMFAGTLLKQRCIDGFIRKGLLEPASLLARHEALAEEMTRRGYNHTSPLPVEHIRQVVSQLPEHMQRARVNPVESLTDLLDRCEACRKIHDASMSTAPCPDLPPAQTTS